MKEERARKHETLLERTMLRVAMLSALLVLAPAAKADKKVKNPADG